ncbi:MAG TPA: hypothetical protein VF727_13990 [Allosphingosinicella sp.]|jgi:hypothetical protein
MAFVVMLALLLAAMLVLSMLGAERSFRRSLTPEEREGWSASFRSRPNGAILSQ